MGNWGAFNPGAGGGLEGGGETHARAEQGRTEGVPESDSEGSDSESEGEGWGAEKGGGGLSEGLMRRGGAGAEMMERLLYKEPNTEHRLLMYALPTPLPAPLPTSLPPYLPACVPPSLAPYPPLWLAACLGKMWCQWHAQAVV